MEIALQFSKDANETQTHLQETGALDMLRTEIQEGLRTCASLYVLFAIQQTISYVVFAKSMHLGIATEATVSDSVLLSAEVRQHTLARLLSQGEQFYRFLVENGIDVFYAADTRGVITFCSPQVQRYGYTPAEIVGRPFSDFIVPDDLPEAVRDFEQSLREGKQTATQFRLVAADGSLHPVEETGSRIVENGEVIGAIGIIRDISQRKAVEAELRKSEERLAALNAELESRVRQRTAELEHVNRELADQIGKRERSEAALRLSEQLFRRTFDQSPIGAAIVSLDYRFLRVNAELCRITGYSEKELVARGFPHISDPEDLHANVRQLRRVELGEIDVYQTHKRFIRKDGAFVWTRLSVRMIKDAAGQPLYFLPMMEDVTARKQAELALQESETRFRLVFETLRDGVCFSDLDGRLIDCNRAYLELAGYDALEELRGKSYEAITPPEYHAFEAGPVRRQVLRRGCSDEYEKELIRKGHDRIAVSVQTYLQRDEHNRPIGTWAIVRDITARKKAETERERLLATARAAQRLAEASEQHYRLLGEALPQIVFIGRPDGWIEYHNRHWYEYSGQTAGQAAGLGWRAAVHPDDLPALSEAVSEMLRTEQPRDLEFRLRRADGQYRWFLARAVPLRDGAGKIIKWFGTRTDVHERKQAELFQRLLAEISSVAASCRDPRQLLASIAQLTVPQFADWCLVDVLEGAAAVVRVAAAHGPPRDEDMARRLLQNPAVVTATGGIAEVLRTGRPELLVDVLQSHYSALAGSEARLAIIREVHPTSHLMVPMIVHGRTLGTLTFIQAHTRSGRRFSESDLHLAEEIARRAALAFDYARLRAEVMQQRPSAG